MTSLLLQEIKIKKTKDRLDNVITDVEKSVKAISAYLLIWRGEMLPIYQDT